MKKLLFLFLLPIGLFGQFNLLNASKDEVEENILPFDGQFSKKTIKIALRSTVDHYKYINSRRKEIHNKYIKDKLTLKIINGGFDGKGIYITSATTNKLPQTRMMSEGDVIDFAASKASEADA